MKKRPLSKEKRITQKLEKSLYVFLTLEIVVGLAAVFVWPPLCIAFGVLMMAYGILHLVSARKGWDRFHSFEVGGMADAYPKRHIYTIVNGILLILLGIATAVVLLLMFLGVISI